MSFADHFSRQAADYSRYRPTYPPALYTWLAGLVEGHDAVWDCGTGNGQAATGLADHFRRVVATDASARQIRQARPHARVSYLVAPAERSALAPASVDMVTVAQAIHWFDFDAFYAEVRRVARPGAVLAAWTYDLVTVDPDVDAVVRWFYSDVVGRYWPSERRYVEEQYRTLPFPFDAVGPVPDFEIAATWRRGDLSALTGTWSSTNRYRQDRGEDPVALLEPRLAEVWPDETEERSVRWRIHVRAGRI